METNSQRIAKNTGFLFIRMIAVVLVGLYTSRVVLQALGFEDFGIYNVVGAVVMYFGFLRTALTNATYRYLAYDIGQNQQEQLTKTYSMAINSHLLMAVCLVPILEIVGIWLINYQLNIPETRITAANIIYQFSILTFIISVIQTPFNSSIIAHEHMNFYALISIVEVVLKLGLAIIITHSGFDHLILYAVLMCATAAIIFICYVLYCVITFKDCRYIRFWDSAILKKFCTYSGWSALVNVADILSSQSISIFFNIFLGVVANAALGISNQVITQLNNFLHTFTQAFNPQIIKSYAAKQYDYFMTLIFSTSKVSYYLLLLVSIPIVLNIRFVLSIWLGDYPADAPLYIQAIIIYSLVDSFQAPLWQAVHATGNLKVHQILMSIIKLLAIPTIYILLRFSYDGSVALLAYAGFNIICAIVRTIYMKYLINLDLAAYIKEIVLPIIGVTIISLSASYAFVRVLGDTWQGFLSSSATAVLAIMLCCMIFGLSKQEKQFVVRLPIVKKVINLFSKKQ